ncbi:MAG: cupin domain-containing protein [Actinobacteria bacterium]|nr:cupin domain-containing protein [Actinomycetota bacterium]
MDTRSLTDLVSFSPDGPSTAPVLESERLWSQLICLDRNQRLGPIVDAASDGLFLVVAGEVVVQVDRGRRRLAQWSTAFAPAGSEVVVSNASPDPAVLLIVAAPPPARRPVSG